MIASRKRIFIVSFVTLLCLLAIVYHFVFGYIVVTKVDDAAYMLHRKNIFRPIGANVIVHSSVNDTTLVDSQLGPLAVSTRLKVRQLSNKPIKRVFITHWHPDHSGGISAYSADAEIVAHKNTFAILSSPQEGFGLTKPGSHHEFAARKAEALPTLIVNDRIQIENIEAVHYSNAHTSGDLVVFFDGISAIGDLVWPQSFPFIDVHNGGSAAGLELALSQIIERSAKDDLFIPGHGNSALRLKDLARYLEMVSITRAYIEEQKSLGKSLEEAIAGGLPTKWQSWGSDLVPEAEWITMIFGS